MDYFKAFLVGGAICAVGQVLIDKTRLTPARILTGLLVLGLVLTAVGVYEPLVKWAGAGATVPLSGFGYAIAKGTEKAISKDGLLGVFKGGLSSTSGGIAAAIVFGFLAGLVCKSKSRD